MADITMCNIEYCKMIPFCLRHRTNIEPNEYAQSYLAEPEKDCKDKNYELYIKP